MTANFDTSRRDQVYATDEKLRMNVCGVDARAAAAAPHARGAARGARGAMPKDRISYFFDGAAASGRRAARARAHARTRAAAAASGESPLQLGFDELADSARWRRWRGRC